MRKEDQQSICLDKNSSLKKSQRHFRIIHLRQKTTKKGNNKFRIKFSIQSWTISLPRPRISWTKNSNKLKHKLRHKFHSLFHLTVLIYKSRDNIWIGKSCKIQAIFCSIHCVRPFYRKKLASMIRCCVMDSET